MNGVIVSKESFIRCSKAIAAAFNTAAEICWGEFPPTWDSYEDSHAKLVTLAREANRAWSEIRETVQTLKPDCGLSSHGAAIAFIRSVLDAMSDADEAMPGSKLDQFYALIRRPKNGLGDRRRFEEEASQEQTDLARKIDRLAAGIVDDYSTLSDEQLAEKERQLGLPPLQRFNLPTSTLHITAENPLGTAEATAPSDTAPKPTPTAPKRGPGRPDKSERNRKLYKLWYSSWKKNGGEPPSAVPFERMALDAGLECPKRPSIERLISGWRAKNGISGDPVRKGDA